MNIENEIKILKNYNPDTLIMIKIGVFYHVYGKDASIISYLFGYQIKKVSKLNTCGFPISVLEKILSRLEEEKVFFKVFNNNFDVENENKQKMQNTYEKIYNDSYKYLLKKNRIEEINVYLMENINTDYINKKIEAIEKIINDV
ncbi:MAG: hypothetical protein K1W33_02625 [Clostridia bacterium]|nr:hypothetical protein [Clostridia bacterium]